MVCQIILYFCCLASNNSTVTEHIVDANTVQVDAANPSTGDTAEQQDVSSTPEPAEEVKEPEDEPVRKPRKARKRPVTRRKTAAKTKAGLAAKTEHEALMATLD